MIKPQPSTKLKTMQMIQMNRGEFKGNFDLYNSIILNRMNMFNSLAILSEHKILS